MEGFMGGSKGMVIRTTKHKISHPRVRCCAALIMEIVLGVAKQPGVNY